MQTTGPIVRSNENEVVIGYPTGSLYETLVRVACPRCGARPGIPCIDVGMHKARKLMTPSYKANRQVYKKKYERGVRRWN